MSGTRQNIQYSLALVPEGRGEAPVRGHPKTLRKRFRNELDRGVAEANATISGFLFAAAKAGNITAMIFG